MSAILDRDGLHVCKSLLACIETYEVDRRRYHVLLLVLLVSTLVDFLGLAIDTETLSSASCSREA